jgi:hypothetical protein
MNHPIYFAVIWFSSRNQSGQENGWTKGFYVRQIYHICKPLFITLPSKWWQQASLKCYQNSPQHHLVITQEGEKHRYKV